MLIPCKRYGLPDESWLALGVIQLLGFFLVTMQILTPLVITVITQFVWLGGLCVLTFSSAVFLNGIEHLIIVGSLFYYHYGKLKLKLTVWLLYCFSALVPSVFTCGYLNAYLYIFSQSASQAVTSIICPTSVCTVYASVERLSRCES